MPRKYTTTLNTRPLMFRESLIIAQMLLDGEEKETIHKKVVEENIFQKASEDRAKRFSQEIVRRLNELDDYLLGKFVQSDTQTAKLILLYGLIKKDRLFYEWMREVVFEKRMILDNQVKKTETRRFLEQKSEQEEVVRKWTEETKERLANAYHQTLADAELAVNTKNQESMLQMPLIDPSVQQYLIEKKERPVVEVLLGEPIV